MVRRDFPGEREPLIAKLLDLYVHDPDSGIHGAAEWTLRQWEQAGQIKTADTELASLKDKGPRRWYVNGQGQTFAVIEGPSVPHGITADGARSRCEEETSHLR